MLSLSRGRSPASLPAATVARLPAYVDALAECARGGHVTVSSVNLAASVGVTPAKLRKDLSFLGSFGTRGVGYRVDVLRTTIADVLGCHREWPVVLVGCGHLGTALAHFGGFGERGFRIVGLIDADSAIIGTTITVGGRHLQVRGPEHISQTVHQTGAEMGVIATPASAAQECCDRLVAAGVSGVLNFAAIDLQVPPHIGVRRIDIAAELQILAFHQWHRGSAPGAHAERSA